jgi:5-methylcytosine-specific restriction endonuclease McrA
MPANGRLPYSDPRWTRIRLVVLARDGYRCTEPGPRHSHTLDVDHIEPWTMRPDLAFDLANLRTLCRLHHNRKTHGRRETRRRNSRRW